MGLAAISSDHLTLQLWLHERLMALHGSVSVPLLAIQSIDAHPDLDFAKEMESGEAFVGTYVPGRLIMGRDRKMAEKKEQGPIFFDVNDPSTAVAITVDAEHFKKLVFSVDEPDLWCSRLRLAVDRAREKAGWEPLPA